MTIHINHPKDFNFLECLNAHGWKSLLPFTWNPDTATLERVEEFGIGNVVLLKMTAADGAVTVEAKGDASKDEIARRVRRMLQLDLPMGAFHDYCREQPALAHVPEKCQGRLLTSPTLFEDVLKVIATTNTTWAQTKSMVARLVHHYGTPLTSDPARRAFPRPDQIAAVPFDDFAATAKLGYRNAAVHKIATDVASGALALEGWFNAEISSPDLFKRLIGLPGVGPYSASCLMIYLGCYERVNVDSWARTLVGKELGRTVTDKEAHAFFEPYGEWRALVYHFYAWKENEPVA